MLPGLQELGCAPANTPDTKGITNTNGWMIDPPIELPIAYYDDDETSSSEERIAVRRVDTATVNSHQYRGSTDVNYNVVFRDSRDPDSFHVWLHFVHNANYSTDEVFPDYFTLNFEMDGVPKEMNNDSTMYGLCRIRLLPVIKEIIAAGA